MPHTQQVFIPLPGGYRVSPAVPVRHGVASVSFHRAGPAPTSTHRGGPASILGSPESWLEDDRSRYGFYKKIIIINNQLFRYFPKETFRKAEFSGMHSSHMKEANIYLSLQIIHVGLASIVGSSNLGLKIIQINNGNMNNNNDNN